MIPSVNHIIYTPEKPLAEQLELISEKNNINCMALDRLEFTPLKVNEILLKLTLESQAFAQYNPSLGFCICREKKFIITGQEADKKFVREILLDSAADATESNGEKIKEVIDSIFYQRFSPATYPNSR